MTPRAYYNEIDPYAAQWLRNLIAAGHIAPGDVDERSIELVQAEGLKGYTQCHLFAGIGVWSHALRRAGWPDDRPVWSGSCPCQPFSTAGKGRGFKDKRHLWPAWFRLIEKCRPGTVFGEQVANKLALGWLDTVQADLEDQDYAFGAVDLCAAGVGGPHIRQRLYFVADAGSFRRRWRQGSEERGVDDWSPAGRAQSADGSFGLDKAGSGLLDDPDVLQRSRVGRTGEGDGQTQDGTDQPGEAGLVGNAGGPGLEGRFRGFDSKGSECAQRLPSSGVGATVVLGHSVGPGLPERPFAAFESGALRVQGSALGKAEPLRGFWKGADWLYCRDGKYRPTQPGLEPLVTRLAPDMGSVRPGEDSPFRIIQDPKTGKSIGQAPWRIGMLKAYGNALCAETAVAFIRAYLEVSG